MLTIKAKLGLKTLTLVIFGMSTLLTFYIASANLKQPIYEGDTVINVWWSHDASELVFQNGLFPGMRDAEWFSFDTREQTLTSQADWPLFDRLNKVQRDLVAESVGENGLIFLSPNDRYIVHNRVVPGRVSDVVLTDSVTRESINLEIRARSITRGTDHFHVKWSGDSNSFAVRTACTSCTFSDGRYFVDAYNSDVTAVRVRDITNITDSNTGSRYFTSVLYDVSTDGSHIVTSSLTTGETGEEERNLVVWGVGDNFTADVIPTLQNQSFGDIVWVPQDGEKLLLTRGNDIVLYDIGKNSEQIVASPISLAPGDSVYISPDGNWLAVSQISSPGEMGMYVARIPSLDVASLRLTSLCSLSPETVRVWRVRNTNPDPVDFTWDVVGADQTGSGTVPGGLADNPGEVTFETVAVDGPNTTRIFVDGEQQDVATSDDAYCRE